MRGEREGRRVTLAVRMVYASVAQVLIVGMLGGCGSSATPHSETISQADFDGTWPFRVSSGTLRCVRGVQHPPLGAVVLKVDGTDYAINGAALGSGYPPASPIRDESHSRFGDMRAEGTSLCSPNWGP
jgi:hypothetical protein